MTKKKKLEYLKSILDTMRESMLAFQVLVEFIVWVWAKHPQVWEEFLESYTHAEKEERTEKM